MQYRTAYWQNHKAVTAQLKLDEYAAFVELARRKGKSPSRRLVELAQAEIARSELEKETA